MWGKIVKIIESQNYKQSLVNQFGREESTHANDWEFDFEDTSINKVRNKKKKKKKIAQSMSKLDRKTKNQLNGQIIPMTQGYHNEIPLGSIFNILNQNNIVATQEDGTEWSGMLIGQAQCGSDRARDQVANFSLAFKNETGLIPISNSDLSLSWCVMPSGRYEIVAYLS